MPDDTSNSTTTSSTTSEPPENGFLNPQVTKKIRQRMQPNQQPLWDQTSCTCCGKNFLEAKQSLTKFRESIAPQIESAQTGHTDLTDNERRILLSDNFVCRLLARCDNDFKRAQERLSIALTVHRKYLLDEIHACTVCLQNPGYHSFRQVGFDRLGRPVLYTCLNQDMETSTHPQHIRNYFMHLIRCLMEAEKTLPEDQHSMVFVFDTNGLVMSHLTPDTVSQFAEMLRYFPARFCYALLLNLSVVTRFFLKPAIHLTGHQEDILVLSNRAMDKQLSECFEPPLVCWIMKEIERNKQSKMPFFSAPETADGHDPRGESFYVENYIRTRHKSGHRPHASIVVALGSSVHDVKE